MFGKRSRKYTVGKRSLAAAVALMMAIYGCVTYIPNGIVTETLSVGALTIIGLTALARVNDIERTCISKRWQARRVGLTMAGTGAVALAAAQLFNIASPPEWRLVIFELGVMLTWITTPKLPPWWKWISYKDEKEAHL